MKKNTLIGFSLCVAIGCSAYLFLYKGHRNIETETVDYVVTISGLEKEFTANDSLAYAKYQDEIIEITAKVTSVDLTNKGIVLGDKVFATFIDSVPKEVVSGKTLKIKGRFLGYDELLQEFKIDQITIIQ
jgi:hypothetical protein